MPVIYNSCFSFIKFVSDTDGTKNGFWYCFYAAPILYICSPMPLFDPFIFA